MTEQVRKTELLFLSSGAEEHRKGINADAPMVRPCKLIYAGNTGSIVETTNDTDDSLKERVCKDIDVAKTSRNSDEVKINNNKSGERTTDRALVI